MIQFTVTPLGTPRIPAAANSTPPRTASAEPSSKGSSTSGRGWGCSCSRGSCRRQLEAGATAAGFYRVTSGRYSGGEGSICRSSWTCNS